MTEKMAGTLKLLGTAGLLAALIYAGLCALLYLGQRKMIYFPMCASEDSLRDQAAAEGLLPWHVGGRHAGWQTTNIQARACLLMLHGNAGYAAHRISYFRELLRLTGEFQVFLLEYPGYGARPGEPTEASLVGAAREAMQSLPPDKPVYLMGESLGSGVAVAIWPEFQPQVRGVILVVPFSSLREAARHHYPWLPTSLILRDRFEVETVLRGRDMGPLFVALAGRDEVVPMALGKKLFEAYGGRKQIWIAPEAGHNDLGHPDAAWWGNVLTFLGSNPPPARPADGKK